MSYLLDTCTLSECARKIPQQKVLEWLNAQNEDSLYLSVIVIGELAKGIARLDESTKKNHLSSWLYTDLLDRFNGRILPVTQDVALEWGMISGRLASEGRTISMADGLIAATARKHSLVVATRNVNDLLPTGVPVFNPWTDLD